MEKITLEDIKKYTKDNEKRFSVIIDSNYRFKLKKVKDILNIDTDARFLREVIDLYYNNYYTK